jgi:hypothetical protein
MCDVVPPETKAEQKIIIPIALILSHPEGHNKPKLYSLSPSPLALPTPPPPLTTMKRCNGPCGIKMDESGYSITIRGAIATAKAQQLGGQGEQDAGGVRQRRRTPSGGCTAE